MDEQRFTAAPARASTVSRDLARWLCACAAALLAACAVPAPGTAEHAQIQGAIDGVGKLLAAATGGGQLGQSGALAGQRASGDVILIDNVPVAVGAGAPKDPRWSGTPLRDTPLHNIFASAPLGNCSPCYPRVAITIKDFSETLLSLQAKPYIKGVWDTPPRPPECVKFDARIWRSPTKREDLKDILVCNGTMQKTDKVFAKVQISKFDASFARSPHTQEVRTLGPKPPYRLLGNNTREDLDLWSNGFYLFGNLFVLTGFQGLRQIEGVPDDRVWFVNLADVKKT